MKALLLLLAAALTGCADKWDCSIQPTTHVDGGKYTYGATLRCLQK